MPSRRLFRSLERLLARRVGVAAINWPATEAVASNALLVPALTRSAATAVTSAALPDASWPTDAKVSATFRETVVAPSTASVSASCLPLFRRGLDSRLRGNDGCSKVSVSGNDGGWESSAGRLVDTLWGLCYGGRVVSRERKAARRRCSNGDGRQAERRYSLLRALRVSR